MVGTSADVLATSHRESKAEQSPASIHSHATALPWLGCELSENRIMWVGASGSLLPKMMGTVSGLVRCVHCVN